jgi:cyanophycinase
LRLALHVITFGVALILGTARADSPVARAEDSPATRPANDAPPRGHLLIVGGGAMPDPLVRRFLDLAGGAERARILVLPMAAGDGGAAESVGRADAEMFRRRGAASVEVLSLTRPQANDPSIAERFRGATAVWFSGGQQTRLMEVLRDTPAAAAIHARYRDGAAVGGTSAGAAVMSRLMIDGGERRPSTRPTTDTGTYETVQRDNVLVAEGLGLFPSTVIDQHFLRRRRHNRLLSVVLEHPDLLGAGIDEATALQVNPDGTWDVLGRSVVVVIDARRATVTPAGVKALGAADVRLHVLPGGSRFDPAGGKAALPEKGADAARP